MATTHIELVMQHFGGIPSSTKETLRALERVSCRLLSLACTHGKVSQSLWAQGWESASGSAWLGDRGFGSAAAMRERVAVPRWAPPATGWQAAGELAMAAWPGWCAGSVGRAAGRLSPGLSEGRSLPYHPDSSRPELSPGQL